MNVPVSPVPQRRPQTGVTAPESQPPAPATNATQQQGAGHQRNDRFIRYLTDRYGTGRGQRFDAGRGVSQTSGAIMDAYATTGQMIPAHMATAMRELDEIDQREAMLARASPSARVALRGTGYDALAARQRAEELERMLFEGSAEARNAGAALEHRRLSAQVAQLEIQTNEMAATSSARTQAQLARFDLERRTSEGQIDQLERAEQLEAAMTNALQMDLSIQDLEEIFASNDPALMEQVFGTTDRRTANDVLRQMRIEASQDQAQQLNLMTQATQLQAAHLLEGHSEQDIQAMIADPTLRPPGTSLAALTATLRDLQATQDAANSLLASQTQGAVDEMALQTTGVESLTMPQMVDALYTALSAQGPSAIAPEMMQMAMTSQGLNELASALLEATGGGQMPIAIETPLGPMEVSAGLLLETFAQRQSAQQAQTRQALIDSDIAQRMMREHAETERQVRTTEAMLGVQFSPAVRATVDSLMADARQVLQFSMEESDAEQRSILMDMYHDRTSNVREFLGDTARRMGASENIVEDAVQGRFMSTESYTSALVSAFDVPPGEENAQNPLVRTAVNVLRSRNITREQLRAWHSGPDREDLNALAPGLREELADGVRGLLMEGLAANGIQAVMQIDQFRNLPPDTIAALERLSDFAAMRAEGLSQRQVLDRVEQVVASADRMLLRQSEARSLSDPDYQPTYAEGQLHRAFTDAVSQAPVNEMLFGSDGTMDRSMAAILTETIGARGQAVHQFGSSAISYEDLPQVAISGLRSQIRAERVGASLTHANSVSLAVARDRGRILENSGMLQIVGQGAQPQFNAAEIAIVEQALYSIYVDKVMDPSIDRSTFFGMELPSFGASRGAARVPRASWSAEIATGAQVQERLRVLGHDDIAERIRVSN